MSTNGTTFRNAGRRGAARGELLVAAAAMVLVAAGIGVLVYGVWRSREPRKAQFTSDLNRPLPASEAGQVVCEEIGGGFATGFKESRCLAVGPNDTTYVSGDSAVRVFDPNGRRVREVEVVEPPGPLAVAGDGTLYVASRDRVFVYSPAGRRRAAWPGAGADSLFTSLAVTDSDVVVADAGRRVVRRYDHSGKLLKTIGRKDPSRNIPGFIVPSPYFDLAAAPDGLLRVVSPGRHRIEAYTLDGSLEQAWGRYAVGANGFCGCCNPANFALIVGGTGGGFAKLEGFVTAEKGTTRVKLHDARGELIGLVAPGESFRRHDELLAGRPAGRPFQALDVAANGWGRILVLDPMTNGVRLFRRTAAPTRKEAAQQ